MDMATNAVSGLSIGAYERTRSIGKGLTLVAMYLIWQSAPRSRYRAGLPFSALLSVAVRIFFFFYALGFPTAVPLGRLFNETLSLDCSAETPLSTAVSYTPTLGAVDVYFVYDITPDIQLPTRSTVAVVLSVETETSACLLVHSVYRSTCAVDFDNRERDGCKQAFFGRDAVGAVFPNMVVGVLM